VLADQDAVVVPVAVEVDDQLEAGDSGLGGVRVVQGRRSGVDESRVGVDVLGHLVRAGGAGCPDAQTGALQLVMPGGPGIAERRIEIAGDGDGVRVRQCRRGHEDGQAEGENAPETDGSLQDSGSLRLRTAATRLLTVAADGS
jgi:hypothetical protein